MGGDVKLWLLYERLVCGERLAAEERNKTQIKIQSVTDRSLALYDRTAKIDRNLISQLIPSHISRKSRSDRDKPGVQHVTRRVISYHGPGLAYTPTLRLAAGAVMEAKTYAHELGADSVIPWGTNMTGADVIMSDGKSIERVGVIPDEAILPSADDMVAHRDPVMVRAVELAGGKIDPLKAGQLFPIEWRNLH